MIACHLRLLVISTAAAPLRSSMLRIADYKPTTLHVGLFTVVTRMETRWVEMTLRSRSLNHHFAFYLVVMLVSLFQMPAFNLPLRRHVVHLLTKRELSGNALSTLPAGLFSGLESLLTL